jgi:hypothetical protein
MPVVLEGPDVLESMGRAKDASLEEESAAGWDSKCQMRGSSSSALVRFLLNTRSTLQNRLTLQRLHWNVFCLKIARHCCTRVVSQCSHHGTI